MLEIKITVECPGLPEAIHALADALHEGQANPVSVPIPDSTTPTAASHAPARAAAPTTAVPLASAPTPAHGVAAPTVPVAPAAPAVPVAAPVAPAAPAAPAPAVPVAAPTYTLDQIARAGAALVDAGKMEQLLALLGKYGVAAVTQLAPEQHGSFATELRALGAQI